MKIKYGSVFGNYEWSASAEITPEIATLLAPLGALQIAQRSPSTAAEKAMAGYEKRPKGFTRTDIPFDSQKAEILKKAQSVLVIENGDKKIEVPVEVEVTEHVETVQDVKMTDERNAYGRNGENRSLAVLAKKVGYTGELGDGTKSGAPIDFLRAIRAWSKEQIKNA